MSILIKGIDMPKNGGMKELVIGRAPNGTEPIAIVSGDITEFYKIIEIPTPHGRLIDADCLIKILQDTLDSYPNNYNDGKLIEKLVVDVCKQLIEHCPTIIEAEVSE